MIPKSWKGFGGSNGITFAILSVFCYMLDKIDESNVFKSELEELLSEFPDINPSKVGFPEEWRDTIPWAL